MRLEEILAALSRHRDELEALGVKSLAVFGSTARNEAQSDSDVDLLVEFDRPVGLFEFLAVNEYLEALLGHPVDLVTSAALKPQMRDQVLREAVDAA